MMIFYKELRINFKLLLFYLIILFTIFTKDQCHSRVTGYEIADMILYDNLDTSKTVSPDISSYDFDLAKKKILFLEKLEKVNVGEKITELKKDCELIYNYNQCQDIFNIIDDKEENNKNKEELLKKTQINAKIIKKNLISVTTAIHANSISIALDTLKNKYIGFGFQKYELGYKLYMNKTNINENYLNDLGLNFNDGASNFAKIIVEFGWFFIFFTLIFFYFLIFCKNINFTIRFFLLAIIITQGIRGAGYYNGMFLFFVILILTSIYLNLQNYFKTK